MRAEPTATPGELVERCDTVLLCLDDTATVQEVVFGADGVAVFAADEQILVDLSATAPAATRWFARELAQRSGMAWVDAPVVGDLEDAQQGSLLATVGGAESDVERVRPLLELFCARVSRMGDVGTGQAARLCHAMLAGATALALAETDCLGRAQRGRYRAIAGGSCRGAGRFAAVAADGYTYGSTRVRTPAGHHHRVAPRSSNT